MRTSYMVREWAILGPLSSRRESTPEVALPCGSRSTSNTRNLRSARATARFIAVVVLPTPPFWLAIATTRPTSNLPPAQKSGASGHRIASFQVYAATLSRIKAGAKRWQKTLQSMGFFPGPPDHEYAFDGVSAAVERIVIAAIVDQAGHICGLEFKALRGIGIEDRQTIGRQGTCGNSVKVGDRTRCAGQDRIEA